MGKILNIIMLVLTTGIIFGQSIDVSFKPIIEDDSVRIGVYLDGDGATALGSSNFVYSINQNTLQLSQARFRTFLKTNTSYNVWDYAHNDEFEHIFLSRTHQPNDLVGIENLLVGEVKYKIKNKCDTVHLKWDKNRGDIRTLDHSIKERINFKDTSFVLVSPIDSPVVFEEKETQKLSVINANGNLVHWYRDGQLISNSETILANIFGTYSVKVSNGCEVKDSQEFEVERITSNEEIIESVETKLYPNPVNDVAILNIDKKKLDKIQQVFIVNNKGQEIKKLTSDVYSSSTVLKINTWDITHGVYFVKIVYSEGSEIIRFIY